MAYKVDMNFSYDEMDTALFYTEYFFKVWTEHRRTGRGIAAMLQRRHPLCGEKSPDTSCIQQVINVHYTEGLRFKYFEMTHYSCITELWTFLFRVFSSVVMQMPGYNSQRQGTARTLPT